MRMNRRVEWDVLDLTVDNEKDLSDGKFDMQLKRLVSPNVRDACCKAPQQELHGKRYLLSTMSVLEMLQFR